MRAAAATLFGLFKLRIGFAIMLCALAGVAVTPGDAPGTWRVAILALAVLLSSASAGAFNQYVERDIDAHMKRTRRRPFVTGEYRAGWVWPLVITGLLMAAVAAAAWVANLHSALYVFLGAFTYGIVYTVWLKRRTWMNIVWGGLAGSFAVLAGAAAVDPGLSPAPLILALVLFLWTPPHFWSLAFVYKRDYARVGVPMLPVVVADRVAATVILGHTLALVAISVLPVFWGMSWIYLMAAVSGGAWFVLKSIELVREPEAKRAWSNFHASLLQLTLLLVGAMLDRLILGAA